MMKHKWWLPLCMVVPFSLNPPAVVPMAIQNIEIEHLAHGAGRAASEGQIATYAYTCASPGAMLVGTKKTLTCPVGSRKLIEGWRRGTRDMRIGEVRRVTVPPHMAYGDEGRAPMIPPKTTLVFEITLTGLKAA